MFQFVRFANVLYIYVLLSKKDRSLYIGYSANLKNRIDKHNKGLSKATKHKRPYKLLFYEAFINRVDAKHREEYLKSGLGFSSINKLLRQTLIGEVA